MEAKDRIKELVIEEQNTITRIGNLEQELMKTRSTLISIRGGLIELRKMVVPEEK
ncbi:hypothetical protein KAR91_63575 [Candidatus Pacearchaeota archaeon]|nr:hypothetical protein [Candidatus Pacearchaeota archaeon]